MEEPSEMDLEVRRGRNFMARSKCKGTSKYGDLLKYKVITHFELHTVIATDRKLEELMVADQGEKSEDGEAEEDAALDKIRFESLTDKSKLDGQLKLFIRLVPTKTNKTHSVIDCDINLTKAYMVNNLDTIARYELRILWKHSKLELV
ncbi:unnamed protein product [Arabis nemorensis]|uniref:Uncharacterized protein n=1 Tax=Arabis nemorensis TaxID=586526 RepID=A0A565BU14_9BRAS|nr:unnamed protein product [Arabis nemorensis]